MNIQKSLNKNKTKEFSDTNIYNNSKVNIKKINHQQ